MVPPTLPTAACDALQQRGAGDRHGRSFQERRARMLGRQRRRFAARLSAPQLVEQSAVCASPSRLTGDIGNRETGRRQQPAEHGDIKRNRNQRRARQRAGDGAVRNHRLAVFLGSTPRLDMETLAGVGGRARGRGIEGSAGEMLRLLDQRNQRRRVAGDA